MNFEETFKKSYEEYGKRMTKYIETKELKWYWLAKDSLDCMLFSARQIKRGE